MLICILTKNVITSCSVTMMLFLHLEVKPLMTLTTVLYLSCALISGHLAMMLMELTKRRWNNSLKTKLSLLPKKLFRIRMSRNFGMKMLTMTNLSTECLIQLTKLGYDATPFNQILKQNAKREMRLRLGKVTVADVLAAQPV